MSNSLTIKNHTGNIFKQIALPVGIVALAVFGYQHHKTSLGASGTPLTDKAALAPAAAAKGVDFRIAVIPDIQYYTGIAHGGNMNMFLAQIRWIKKHQADSNIVYVSGMGDTVDDTKIDSIPVDQQWINASTGYYMLEAKPELAYGVTVGNHDELDTAFPVEDNANRHNHPGLSPLRNTTQNYNKYFGVDHFKNKPWYGGHANIMGKNNNDCHWDKFTVGGQKYIVIYIPFDNTGDVGEDKDGLMMKWAHSVLEQNRDARAILVSHGILESKKKNIFNNQGKRMYDAVKDMPNVFMMLCGHVTGEYMREDVYNGHTIKTYMIDCQGNPNGGNGRMRTMRINSATGAISINSFSPYAGENM